MVKKAKQASFPNHNHNLRHKFKNQSKSKDKFFPSCDQTFHCCPLQTLCNVYVIPFRFPSVSKNPTPNIISKKIENN